VIRSRDPEVISPPGMNTNGMIVPTSMYRGDRHQHYYPSPSMTSYPVYGGGLDGLPRPPSVSAGTTPTSSPSVASPFFVDSPTSSVVRGSQLPSTAAAAAAAAVSWRSTGSGVAGGFSGSSQCLTSSQPSLPSCTLFVVCILNKFVV